MNVVQVKDTYVTKKGAKLKITLADPDFKAHCEFMIQCICSGAPGLDVKLKSLLEIMHKSIKYDEGKNQTVYRPMHVTAEIEMPGVGTLFHSTPQTTEPTAGLGYIIRQNASVCREKAMHTHLIMAALGIYSQVVTGTVKTADGFDRHAWVIWVDPASMRVPGPCVVDGTWGKAFTDGYYYSEYVVETDKQDEYFRPKESFATPQYIYDTLKKIRANP